MTRNDWWADLYDETAGDTHNGRRPTPGRTVTVTGRSGRLPDWRTGQTADLTGPPDDEEEEPADEPDAPTTPDSQEEPQVDKAPTPPRPPRRRGRGGATRHARRRAEAAYDWWSRRPPRQRCVLTNGAAAATGAWGYGMLTAQWHIGIPQLVHGWMSQADAATTSPATPFIVGGILTLTAAATGTTLYNLTARPFAHTPAVCTTLHWLLVRVPTTSAATAVLLYTTH